MINDDVVLCSHDGLYPIFGSISQVQTSDNRDCDIRTRRENGRVSKIRTTQAEAIKVLEELDSLSLSQRKLADALGLAENKLSKVRAGERRLSAGEYAKSLDWLGAQKKKAGIFDGRTEWIGPAPKKAVETSRAYVPVEILPSYAGMGGGGSGEGEVESQLVPRQLVEDELRARPQDLLLIDARGESMAPDFLHGDQILVDRRDNDPVQPGAFALWDGDGYVIKLVERVPRKRGRYRIFSSDDRFSSYEVDEDDIRIMGRPVWFGRRL